MEGVVTAIIFGTIFGIFYLFFSTRNKERLALIEKGVDAKIFYKGDQKQAPFWKVLVLNLAVLLMGIGLGVFIAAFVSSLGVEEEVAYPGTIFLLAGTGLLIGFNLTKKLEKE